MNGVPVLLEWKIQPLDGDQHITFRKRITLAAAPRDGDYIVHHDGWAAESAWSVMICAEYVFVRFKPELPASLGTSDLAYKLEDIGWEEL